MSTFNEKADNTPNVLTITRPAASRQTSGQSVEVLSTIEDIDSTHSLSPTHTQHNEKSDEIASSPLSPFYSPNPTRYSLEAQKSESKQNINDMSTPYDTDVEACLTPQKTKGSSRLLQTRSRQDMDCTVWPGQNAMKKKKKEMRRQRGKNGICGCLAGFDKKTKIWIKIAIAILVIGAAVGVGVGISKAVDGGVWKSKSKSNAPIEGTGSN